VKLRLLLAVSTAAIGVTLGLGCGDSGPDSEDVGSLLQPVAAPLAKAYCSVKVQGVGSVSTEDNYLPRVLACENGEAGPEALKAQAIAARSVVYYAMATAGSICNSESCQVYSCGKTPQQKHYDAVKATAGMYLAYANTLTYGFFVNGDSSPPSSTCVSAKKGANQKYVTYNEGKSGTGISQTKLGWVGAPGNGQNRGCMSQWGARCLEDNKSYGATQILKFFYGDDISVLTAPGTCTATSTEPPPPTETELQPMTRDQILHLSQSGVGLSYWAGHARWDSVTGKGPGKCSKQGHVADPPGATENGADAPGFVAQVWQVPSPNPPEFDRHPYGTKEFRYDQKHWFPIKRKDLKRGDALVLHDGKSGHVLLFDKWTAGGKALVFECAGCDVGCVHRAKSISKGYVAIRRRKLNDPDPNQPPTGTLEQASCDKLVGFAQDPDDPSEPSEVIVSFDGPISQRGAQSVTVLANQKRNDLCQLLGSCDHGFEVVPPAGLKNGKRHTFYVYAADTDRGPPRLLLGAPRTVACGGGSVGACTHGDCAVGAALAASCGSCAANVCAKRPSCCSSGWDAQCVAEAQTLCGCSNGSCLHDPCTTGDPLAKSCSPCTDYVCILRPSCCQPTNGSWDATCVDLALQSVGACAGVCATGPSQCAHSECTAGPALDAGCSACANSVCTRDPFCCSGKWDWICAKEAKDDPLCACKK